MNKITYRQICEMTFLCLMSLKLLSLPALVYTDAKNDSWFVILVSTIIDIIVIFMLMYLLKDAKKKNLKEYLESLVGKIVSRLILLILLVGFIVQLSNVFAELFTFVSFNVYDKFPWWLFLIPLIAVAGFMSYKGLRNITRTAEVFYILLAVGVIFICFSTLSKANFEAVKPFFSNSAADLFKAGFKNNAFFGSGLFLLVAFGDVDYTDNKKRYLWFSTIAALLIIQFTSIIFYGLFENTANQHFFALADMTQITSTSSALYRVQWLVSSFWIINQIGYSSLILFASAKTFEMLFNIKKWYFPNIIIMALLSVWVYFIAEDGNLVYIFNYKWVSIIFLIFNIVVPVFLFFIRLIRRRKFEKVDFT